MSRLVVVSNRTSPDSTVARGGLAVALLATLQHHNGLWFGWNGKVQSAIPRRPELSSRDGVDYATIPLSRQDYDDYYKGYSNRVLWPLCHLRLDLMEYERRYEEGYARVNALFAAKLLPLLHKDDSVWVHDYHCIPLGFHLRQAGFDGPLGFFLHIPFPPYDLLRTLPNAERLIRSLCTYDLVGFQTEIDKESFLASVHFGLPDARVRNNRIEYGGRTTRVGAFPISVDVDEIVTGAASARTSAQVQRLLNTMFGRKLIFGLDRLDYSKGLPQRFRAFERLLETYPANRGKLVLLQIAQPSRDDVPEYQQIRHELDLVAGEINGRFADYDWAPIRYINKSYARRTVLGFLSVSDICFITPLRDGMNLVAKEFVAAQNPGDPGVLVLSNMTGAARELDGALIVNPYDIEAVAEGLAKAVAMPLAERRERWDSMIKVIRASDIHRWRKRFVKALEG